MNDGKKKKRGKSLEQHWPLTMTGYLKVHPKITYVLPATSYSHHSIKRPGSIKRPAFKVFKKSLLNVQYDPKFW